MTNEGLRHIPRLPQPLGADSLLDLVNEAEDELKPAVTVSPTAFLVATASSMPFFAAASSAAASFFTVASSATFFFSATSFVAFYTVAASSAAFFFTAASSAAFFTAATSTAAFFKAAASSANFFAVAASVASFSAAALVATAMSSVVELLPDPLGTIAHAATDVSGCGAVAMGGGGVDQPLSGALICLCSGTSSSDDTSSLLWTTRTTIPFPLLGARVEAASP
jgi:hypothetical protein